MEPQVAQLIGGAGTGKTAELMRIMDRALDPTKSDVIDPREVGFVSFTRAARREASTRAADRWDINPKALEQGGWFRTLHSVCKQCLSVGGELLAEDKAAREWLAEALQEDVSGCGDANGSHEPFSEKHNADKALHLWGTARNRLEPLETVWLAAYACDDKTPDYGYCRNIVERYEQYKRLDGRLDFTDLLVKFAGWHVDVDGAEKCEPDGEPPNLPIWFHDEMQDVSKLSASVFERLISAPKTKWVYLSGDPYQSIFSWAGSDHKCFLDFPHNKRRIMPRSYRCANEILRCGEDILRECSDYWDREIEPAEHTGFIERRQLLNSAINEIDPTESWLVLARSNFQAGRLAKQLDNNGIPWVPLRGRGGWDAPVKLEAIKALLSVEAGAPIDGLQWCQVLKHIPSAEGGKVYLTRGTKSRFADMDDPQDQYAWVPAGGIDQLGATEHLADAIRTGMWRAWIDGADRYDVAVQRWGQDVVDKPNVRVGTIHSAKGTEADNVAVLTTLSMPIIRGVKTQAGADAEQRVWYVAATRARKRLMLLDEKKPRFRKKLPI